MLNNEEHDSPGSTIRQVVNHLSTETDVEQNYKLANELDDAAAPEGLPQAWKKLEGNELEVHVAQEYSYHSNNNNPEVHLHTPGGLSDEETKEESQNTSLAPTASSRSPGSWTRFPQVPPEIDDMAMNAKVVIIIFNTKAFGISSTKVIQSPDIHSSWLLKYASFFFQIQKKKKSLSKTISKILKNKLLKIFWQKQW